MKKAHDRIDRYRRNLVRMGFSAGAGAFALKHGLAIGEETLTYPSPDEIHPPEYQRWGECIFTAVAEEGPFFLEDIDFRSDIRDGQPGQNLRLEFEVFDVVRCEPLPDALVQLWHCNAFGYYSGYADLDPDSLFQSESLGNHVPAHSADRFLRGAQLSDENGKCQFLTIYPGWYYGRTVHIHAKVHFNDSRLITAQFYFPQEINDRIHQTGVYRDRGVSDFRNSNDADLAMSAGGAASWPALRLEGDTYVGTLRIGVLNPHFDHVPSG